VRLAAATPLDAALLAQIPDVKAFKRMCSVVKSMLDSTAPTEVTEGTGDYEQFIDQAKPVCQEVDKLSDEDLAEFLKQQREAADKQSQEQAKQWCQDLAKAKGTPRMEYLEQQEWYPQLKQGCDQIAQHPEVLPFMSAQYQAQIAETLPDQMEDFHDQLEDFFGDEETKAMACKMIEDGYKNGRLDWFEKEAWYPQAVAICENYREAIDDLEEWSDDDEDAQDLAQVIQGICQQIEENEDEMQAMLMESKEWLEKAKPVCKKVGELESEEELQQYIEANKPAIKLLGAAQVVALCTAVKEQADDAKSQIWFTGISSVCGKIGGASQDTIPDKLQDIAKSKAIGFKDAIKNRCASFDKMTSMQLEKAKKEDWYENVSQACTMIKVVPSTETSRRQLRGMEILA